MNRLTLLPAFPSLHQHGVAVYNGREHLLLSNTSVEHLTPVEKQRRQHHHFQPSFRLIENKTQQFPSFFIQQHQHLFDDLSRRLQIDEVVLDYNYQRLLKCLEMMNYERMQHHFDADLLPIEDYPDALEFYLQFDVDLFDMKTCTYHGSRASTPNGLFPNQAQTARYSMMKCQKHNCRFCFPSSKSQAIRRLKSNYLSVVQFSTAMKHRFVNGYETILNCPTSCMTQNIIYALTCPCGQFDYIGYTSMSLTQRLSCTFTIRFRLNS
jgi:hypothetical protein